MTPDTSVTVLIGVVAVTSHLPELARIWAANRADKRATQVKLARENR